MTASAADPGTEPRPLALLDPQGLKDMDVTYPTNGKILAKRNEKKLTQNTKVSSWLLIQMCPAFQEGEIFSLENLIFFWFIKSDQIFQDSHKM